MGEYESELYFKIMDLYENNNMTSDGDFLEYLEKNKNISFKDIYKQIDIIFDDCQSYINMIDRMRDIEELYYNNL
jgi:hypothetical protein